MKKLFIVVVLIVLAFILARIEIVIPLHNDNFVTIFSDVINEQCTSIEIESNDEIIHGFVISWLGIERW